VGDLVGYLLLRPHSTVELIDRAAAAVLDELVTRHGTQAAVTAPD
jgi:hypothetical protein